MSAPSQAALDAFFARVTRARVSPILGHLGRREILVDVRDGEARALRDVVRIRDFEGRGFHCMCAGDLGIELLAGDAPIATLGMHHGISMRVAGWDSDAVLVDGRAFLEWLAKRGAPEWLRRFEEDIARGDDQRRARVAWVSAAPPCLGDLTRYESDDGMPLDADAPEVAAAEASVRAAYASPVLAAAALLAWYGSPAGPYSGYASYEELAEQILFRHGCRFAREAATSDATLRGAARFFASWEMVSAKKSELAEIDDALWARMRPHVPDVSDNRARFESAARISAEARRRRANPAPVRTASGAMEIGVGEERLHGLVSDGTNLFTGDGPRFVAFAPGSTQPRTLHVFEDAFFELERGRVNRSKMIMVSEVNRGTIAKILVEDGGKRVVMASGRQRPMTVAIAPAVLAWMEQAQSVDPGTGFTKQESTIVRFESGRVELVHRAPIAAWGLVADRSALFWIEREEGGLVIATAPPRGGPRAAIARFPESSGSFPSLALAESDVLLIREKTIAKVPMSGGALTMIAETRGSIAALAVDDRDLFAVTEDETSERGTIEHVKLGGSTKVLASYARPRWDRPAIVVDDRAISWTTSDRVLSLPRT